MNLHCGPSSCLKDRSRVTWQRAKHDFMGACVMSHVPFFSQQAAMAAAAAVGGSPAAAVGGVNPAAVAGAGTAAQLLKSPALPSVSTAQTQAGYAAAAANAYTAAAAARAYGVAAATQPTAIAAYPTAIAAG